MVLVDDERVGRLRLAESARSLGFDKLVRAPVKILQLELARLLGLILRCCGASRIADAVGHSNGRTLVSSDIAALPVLGLGKGPFGTLQSGVIPIPILGGVGLVPDDTALRTVVRHLVLSDLSDAIRLVKLGVHAVIVLFDGEGVVHRCAIGQVVAVRSLGLDKPVRAEWQICQPERSFTRIHVVVRIVQRGGTLVGAVSNVASALNIVAVGILQFPLAARQHRQLVRGIHFAPTDRTVRLVGNRIAVHSTGVLTVILVDRNGRLSVRNDGERVGLA